jgi:hypothetical protein
MRKTSGNDRVWALAEAWASIDGRLALFKACQKSPKLDMKDGCYSGYCAEAQELLERLRARGFTITKKRIAK